VSDTHPMQLRCVQGQGSRVVNWTWKLSTCGCKSGQLLGITLEVVEIARGDTYSSQQNCSNVFKLWKDVLILHEINSEKF
jgi:hypothetical protein